MKSATFTVAELLKAPIKVGRTSVHHIWVNPRAIGYGANGLPVLPGSTKGFIHRPTEGLWVRLFRAGDGLRAVAVSGLTPYGFPKQAKQKSGEYWPPSGYMTNITVGQVVSNVPPSLALAVIGTVVRIRDDQSLKTPALNKSEQLVWRDTPVRTDNSGVVLIYLGDMALVNLGSRWSTYDIVP